MASVKYPFVPKSTVSMEIGQFWPIPLQGGRFGCGCVLGVPEKDGKRQRATFLAGLVDWWGDSPPTEETLKSPSVLDQGFAHIKVIAQSPQGIVGRHGGLVPYLWAEHHHEKKWALYRGCDFVRFVSHDEAQKYPRRSTWGFDVLRLLAEKGRTKR